jgi:hypothetical protein
VGYEKLRSEIIHCLAMVEALIDFGEGEDIEDGVYEEGILLFFVALPLATDALILRDYS